MAQIITTSAKFNNNVIYTPIASIKQYSEPDFEDRLYRYSKSIFKNFHVFKFKLPISSPDVSGNFAPDLLLISHSFKKWVIIEVELCKTPSVHTTNQIKCFHNPNIKSKDLVDYLVKQDPEIIVFEAELLHLFDNVTHDLLFVLDDYSDEVFSKFRLIKNDLKICVLEVYKTLSHPYEAFRFGGDYPYEISNSSKLQWIDNQHYLILRSDFAKSLPTSFEIKYHMEPFDAKVISRGNKYFLKLPEHNIPKDYYLQIGQTINLEFVIQKL